MKFSLLLPTLGTRVNEIHRLFKSIESQTYKNIELIIVTQDNHDIVAEIVKKYSINDVKHIRINEKGISVSRNAGLPYVSGDILTFTDDDGWYVPNAFETVKSYMEEYNPDIATFMHTDPDKNEYTKVYPNKQQINFSKRYILKQRSFDIYINIKNVPDYKIGFDERFGVGKTYNSGEENIYLMDLYNKGYKKMCFFPELIAYHPKKDNNYLDERSFIAKGPLFKRLFGNTLGLPMFIVFGIKKSRLVDNFGTIFIKGINESINFKL